MFWSYVVLVLGLWTNFFIYRVQFPLRSIFSKAKLPAGYYHRANFTTNCKTLGTPATKDEFKFCEDATFWDIHNKGGELSERKVVVSCDANRKQWNTVLGPLENPEGHGSLWLLPTESSASDGSVAKILLAATGRKTTTGLQKLVLKNYPPKHDFHPLGLQVYPSYGGNTSALYVVNHARLGTTIEQFSLTPGSDSAEYVRTISHPEFRSLNSLALTGPNSFYVTNTHGLPRYSAPTLSLLETLLTLPLSWVSHVTLDQSSPDAVVSHERVVNYLAFANGVAVSPSGNEVAVASTSLAEVYYYTRDPSTNKLKYSRWHSVPFSPDNLHYAADDHLIVAGHPYYPDIKRERTQTSAPSWIVSVSKSTISTEKPPEVFDIFAPLSASTRVAGVKDYDLETWLQSNGSGFAASTTGLYDSRTESLFVPGLYSEEGVLVCKP